MAGHAETDQQGLRVDHHFENSDQQFQSAKLGMWLFLGTEILFFGGLFVAYSVYRSNHPEIFVFGHHFLDKNLGALNTVILICSSLTAAWAVRAAQLRQIKLLKLMIVLTLACAFGFMGVKAVEYNSKWKHGLLWAGAYDPHVEHDGHEAEPEASAPAAEASPAEEMEMGAAADEAAEPAAEEDPANRVEVSTIAPAAAGPAGLADPAAADEAADDEMLQPANAQIYFSIYFLLTGLHGIHVLGGIGAFLWLLRGASRGDFDSGHFTRVDMVALYWHLVDLIWIYLFFLLYLIH
jgi:cytochrome c oxidase subunit 3